MTTATVESNATPQVMPSQGVSCQIQMNVSGTAPLISVATYVGVTRMVVVSEISLAINEDSAAQFEPYEVPGTPSNEQLLALADTHPPPPEWFEGDEEQLF